MQEPRLEGSRFVGDFRATSPSIERFPEDCNENKEDFNSLARILDSLTYQGYILSPKNSYQVNLNLDERILDEICTSGSQCVREPVLVMARDVVQAVGRNADLLISIPGTNNTIVVEIEKANEEKILRDIVKMLLFINSSQANLAALICPQNYAHANGCWGVFNTARQVLRAFIQVTKLPDSTANRLALIGFTQEIFLNGSWRFWDKHARLDFQKRAKPYFKRSD